MRTLGSQHVPASSLEPDDFPLVSLTGISCGFFPGDYWMGEVAPGLLLPGHIRVALLGPCAQVAPDLPVAPGKATA